jgi:hypothetical protein
VICGQYLHFPSRQLDTEVNDLPHKLLFANREVIHTFVGLYDSFEYTAYEHVLTVGPLAWLVSPAVYEAKKWPGTGSSIEIRIMEA